MEKVIDNGPRYATTHGQVVDNEKQKHPELGLGVPRKTFTLPHNVTKETLIAGSPS